MYINDTTYVKLFPKVCARPGAEASAFLAETDVAARPPAR
jgi:hypothetical protein